MVVITSRHLSEAASLYPDAREDIQSWFEVARQARWTGFLDVRLSYPSADAVDGYVIFNIRHKRYRMITLIHYARPRSERLTRGHIYIRSFLTHQQYNYRENWDRRYGR